MKIVVEPYSRQSPDQIFNLILPIQTAEFGIVVKREDQPDLESIPDFYQQGAGNFWVALDGEKVVGSVGLKDIGNRQVALRKMFVDANYRGKEKGIAQELLTAAIAFAQKNGTKDIFLGTTAKFHAAHRFYEKSGFTEIAIADLPPSFLIMKVDTRFYQYVL